MTVKRITYGDPVKAVKQAVKNSNLAIGVAIASQAKLFAPVDKGQLRNSISASSLRETRSLNDRPGEQASPLDTKGLQGDEVYAGSNSDHAVFLEYGTVRQKAQPYLRPAHDVIVGGASVAEIVQKYGREAMERGLR